MYASWRATPLRLRPKAPLRRHSNYRIRPAPGTRSREFKGKWVVLYFYPKDETSGCTTQACELRDNIFAFRKAGDAVDSRRERR